MGLTSNDIGDRTLPGRAFCSWRAEQVLIMLFLDSSKAGLAVGKKRYRHEFGLGLHCATHQILVILISCVVITSLFYPGLDVYTSSKYSSPAILGFDALLSWGSSNRNNLELC